MSVLDVGCGPGGLTAELVKRVGADRVAAVDPASQFVAECSARNPGSTSGSAAPRNCPGATGGLDRRALLPRDRPCRGRRGDDARDGARHPAGRNRRLVHVELRRRWMRMLQIFWSAIQEVADFDRHENRAGTARGEIGCASRSRRDGRHRRRRADGDHGLRRLRRLLGPLHVRRRSFGQRRAGWLPSRTGPSSARPADRPSRRCRSRSRRARGSPAAPSRLSARVTKGTTGGRRSGRSAGPGASALYRGPASARLRPASGKGRPRCGQPALEPEVRSLIGTGLDVSAIDPQGRGSRGTAPATRPPRSRPCGARSRRRRPPPRARRGPEGGGAS